jgi:hypothetical protein
MKGPFKIDNPITSKIDRYKYGPFDFFKNNIRAKNKDTKMYI